VVVEVQLLAPTGSRGKVAALAGGGLGLRLRDAEDRRLADPPTFCWDDAVPAMSAESPVTPRVAIVRASSHETFAPLLLDGIAEDDDGVNFVTVAGLAPSSSSTAAPRSRWLHDVARRPAGHRATAPPGPNAPRRGGHLAGNPAGEVVIAYRPGPV
jgi:hypothetical protein